jgi:hypothetical protein
MPRPKKNFIQRAKERHGERIPPTVNGERNLRKIEDQTKARNRRKLEQWDEFVVPITAWRVFQGQYHDTETLHCLPSSTIGLKHA